MTSRIARMPSGAEVRRPSVAGTFYPADAHRLGAMVGALLAEADQLHTANVPVAGATHGLLVPHAGFVYSGVIAAAAWRLARTASHVTPPTVVILGTNHGAFWLDGVAAWESGSWRTPLGDVEVDAELAGAILALGPPFTVDRAAHDGEHSIEVQLPILQAVQPAPRIVPLSVAAGAGSLAVETGTRLGAMLARRRAAGRPTLLAISSDMAHYPPSRDCAGATTELLPSILGVDPVALAEAEETVTGRGTPGLVCGMCGIQPAVLGLAALREMGATRGTRLAVATSADAGGPADRTVGYLAVAFGD